MDLNKLKEPFQPEDIEWRLQSCGKGKSGIFAICLAYVTNRAIMNRLDEVCGAENWKNEFQKAPDGGVLCGISIKINNEWITKYDGAENTQIEATKGGLSGSMKRAAVQWGIGRYLYKLEENFATILPEDTKQKAFFGKTREGEKFKWLPPALPSWALPTEVFPETKEAKELKLKILDFITTKVITGKSVDRANAYMNNNDVEGMKRTIEWCEAQKAEKTA